MFIPNPTMEGALMLLRAPGREQQTLSSFTEERAVALGTSTFLAKVLVHFTGGIIIVVGGGGCR